MDRKANPTKQRLISALKSTVRPGSNFTSFKDDIVESVFDEVSEVALKKDSPFFNGRRFGHSPTELGACLYALVIAYQGITSDSLKNEFMQVMRQIVDDMMTTWQGSLQEADRFAISEYHKLSVDPVD